MSSADLLAEAATADARAHQCLLTASQLRVGLDPLTAVLAPVAEIHTAATWEGAAADRSRELLRQHHEGIAAVLQDVDGIIARLDQRAADLRWQAGQLRIVAALED
jgi:hypothetical protein